ncbi:MAG: glycoside hydrolase family 3 C-terminal domain-containing protein [Clostridia bacterium]|nr:glycoside hydrolase family 3 C-terminal domain-containing protein [Clostridia bacterium]
MKISKLISPFRGLAGTMAALLVLSVVGYGIADTYRDTVDGALGTESYEISVDNPKYVSDYDSDKEMMAAAKDIAIREGEEGTVIMKNDNGALPLSTSKVALFGVGAYNPYMSAAGNDDQVKLVDALENAGYTIDQNVSNVYTSAGIKPNTSVGDWKDTFTINERSLDDLQELSGVSTSWSATLSSDTTAICVFTRGGGEGNMYKPGSAVDYNGQPASSYCGNDPLALSDIELGVVKSAKEKCGKVIVLINSGNAMEIGEIAASGSAEADAIAYIGVPNDYQFTGIVNVLSGKDSDGNFLNSTGALSNSYVYNNLSAPATVNMGGDYYSDYTLVNANEENGWDSRWGEGKEISNGIPTSSFSSKDETGLDTYSGGQYIVEAEGIYVGYKYYETRYFDSVANTSYNANSTAGSTDGQAWNYSKEMLYTYGYGLSYLDYEQNIKSVNVDRTPNGYTTAVVTVTNKSNTDGKFLAQLYVQQPYTEYDRTNLVEKSAVMFLSSAKVDVKANSSADVEISVPTKYLASYDSNEAKTYILDDGDYLFTAAAGAHEAANNFLSYLGYTADSSASMDADGKGATVVWNDLSSLDATTYATENDTVITNVADNADLNYWLPGTVTYLSRQDWESTYPVNYNEVNDGQGVSLAKSSKKDEWISEIRGEQYTINNNGPEAENVDGLDGEYRFNQEQIGALSYEDFTNINSDYWNGLVAQISVNEAIGAVLHGGSSSDTLTYVDNPVVKQYEGPTGVQTTYTWTEYETDSDGNYVCDEDDNPIVAETGTYKFYINSQTLLSCSFNPDLAYEWGLVEGNSSLWTQAYDYWGSGLTLNRTPYNGRNYEYISEDPMLTNVIGYGVIKGTVEKGTICGPKHMGFNDQEHNRNGVAEYMTEQKFRETDLRGFQGALDDANGLAVMIAFNRIGPVNASHHAGMLQTILRGEWGFKGLISTDMCNDVYYFDGPSMIMAGITQVADFAAGNSYISSDGTNYDKSDSNWTYITINNVKNDATLVNQARENLKYQLYAFANSAILNMSTTRVTPWWETAFKTLTIVSAVLFAVFGAAWIVCELIPRKKED